MDKLSVVSFNARGLRKREKRRTLFRHIRITYKNSIVVLQETHSKPDMENIWRNEWKGQIFFSHGSETGEAGVAILLPCSFEHQSRESFTDLEGRLVCIEIGPISRPVFFMGVYAPATDNQSIKCRFIDDLRDILMAHSNASAIVAGDLNIKLSDLDSDNPRHSVSRASIKLRDFLDEFSLVDAWRLQHSTVKKYTWRRLNPLQQSRIDYAFISEAWMSNEVVKTKIEAGIQSDHNFVYLEVTLSNEARGPGTWRFNNSLLNDTDFVEATISEINKASNCIEVYAGDIPKGTRVELMLSNIRVIAVKRGKILARELRLLENNTYRLVNELDDKIAVSPSEQIVKDYENARQKLDELKLNRGRLAMLKSQATWIEEGEKPTAHFIRTARQRMAKKTITVLQKADGTLARDNRAILAECSKHFRNLYASKHLSREGFQAFSLDENAPRLSDDEKLGCEGPITKEECKFALATMARNKAAGVSGFSAEFFSFFWEQMENIIVEYINEAKSNQQLFVTHRRGVLTLIPKKGNQLNLANKRPICLLDVIYKLIAKVISIRINRVIDKIVHKNQTGFIKGRFIGENTRLIADLMDYCMIDNIEGIMLAVDYRNAFDSIEHDFIWFSLEAFNFGSDIISWIKLLYNGALLTVSNNGYTSDWFPCARGTFQGSPLSGILFNIVAEMLAYKIRSTDMIQGITLNNTEVRISQYCDDTTLFLKNPHSVQNVLQMLRDFQHVSGLEINTQKTKLMWIGANRGKRDSINGIEAMPKIKILGVIHSATENCTHDNVDPVIDRIRSVTNSWSQRSLTIKGRITIAKSLLVSQIVYLASSTKIPNVDLNAIQSLIMKFVWRGRPPKVAFATLCQNIKEGGLNAPDVIKSYEAIRMTWVKRIYLNEDSQWRKLLQARIGEYNINDLLKNRNAKSLISKLRIPEFYKELFNSYQATFADTVNNTLQARAQSLWHNDSLKINGKPVFYKQMYQTGIRLVEDLIDIDGNFMDFLQFREKHPRVTINFLKFQGLISAIPREWKQLIAQDRTCSLSLEEKRCCLVSVNNDARICLRFLRSRHVYDKLIVKKVPTAQRKWGEEGFDIQNWQKLYELPYKCCASTRLQSLQYRIINRYIPTRKYLCTINVIGSRLCHTCFEVENLQHFFYECTDVKEIWMHMLRRLKNLFSLPNEFIDIKVVIFGFLAAPPVVNLVILLCKQHILT